MAVAVSPDGLTLATDLQGSLWTLPASGGEACRITDYFSDVRQPAWSPDGSRIAYFGYRNGSYHIWTIAPDGSAPCELTVGPHDDREPAWSPDGRTIAFSSDRIGQYDIFLLDVATRRIRRLTGNAGEDRMPAWSADGLRIVFVRTDDDGAALWSVDVADGATARLPTPAGTPDAPSLGADGRLAFVLRDDSGSRLVLDGRIVGDSSDVFPFRPSWTRAGDAFHYVADGLIRRCTQDGVQLATVPMTARLEIISPDYPRRLRDWDSDAPRRAIGIVHPVISPDGRRVAFVALSDLYVVSIEGGRPERLTGGGAMTLDPAWSPDGRRIAYTSDRPGDRAGGLPQLWVRDLDTGEDRQLTHIDTQPLGAAWSPCGTRIAFIDANGRWGAAGVCVLDVATGGIVRLHGSLEQPGPPTWSPDGTYVAVSLCRPYSRSFREGTNQIFVLPTDGQGEGRWQILDPHMSIDTRGGGGPSWSPDGTMMAAIYEGLLKIWPTDRDGAPLGPPRSHTRETSHFPSWTADSRTILFQADDLLKTLDIETGAIRTVPIDLHYRLARPEGRTVIRVGRLIDCIRDETQHDKDIVIDGHRIVAVRDHDPSALSDADRFIDASHLTAIPGLIDHHVHTQRDFGAAHYRAWLAYGVTTVRDTGNQLYLGAEDREASEAGTRLGPRIYTTGPLLEWRRVFYKMGLAISSMAHLERELDRARALGHDLLKSYVRMPDIAQRRIVEAAHAMGIPVATHEIYPAAFSGADNTEHMGASSRRGYSPKHGPGGVAYDDVVQLFAASGRVATPTNLCVLPTYLQRNPAYRDDPRLSLYPEWAQRSVLEGDAEEEAFLPMVAGTLRSIKAMHDAGVRLAAGTDTVIAINLHSEIASYVDAGLTPFEALQAATVNPARQLGLDAGTLEAGRLADITLVAGDPRRSIADTFKVRLVVANGRVLNVDDLL